ncbi:hypothetical protein [Burkholderia cenocepacia]|uniref:hypothetical protein n=1 Tax=Burkholderia cenocepacia TaxID=95486 RepID=UPI00117755A3
MNWDDARVFLAIHRERTLRRAAQRAFAMDREKDARVVPVHRVSRLMHFCIPRPVNRCVPASGIAHRLASHTWRCRDSRMARESAAHRRTLRIIS